MSENEMNNKPENESSLVESTELEVCETLAVSGSSSEESSELSADEIEAEEAFRKELELAAQEWREDPVSKHVTKKVALAEEEIQTSPVTAASPSTFILDPYGFQKLEVTEAQNDDEFLIEDAPLDISELRNRHRNTAENEKFELESEETDENSFESTPESEAEATSLFGKLEASLQAESAKFADEHAEMIAETSAEEAAALEEKRLADIAEDVALETAVASAKSEDAEPELDPELMAALPKNPAESLGENSEHHLDADLSDMESAIESLLFIVEKPMSAIKLQELLGPEISFHYFQQALTNLKERYQGPHHGFELIEVAGGFQFRTKAARAALAKKLARVSFQRLSSGAMETLAIIAYRQPAMKETVDEVRGVDSSHFIRTLLDRKFIRISGRSELPGRPMLYETSEEFLQVFSLKDLSELPALSEIEQMVPSSQSDHEEDPRIKQMRKLVSDMKADASVSLMYDPKEDEQFLKDIRERVKSIEVTTPTLQAQDDAAKASKAEASQPGLVVSDAATGSGEQLPLQEQNTSV
jgi:segregation and condensation protein B